MLPFTPDLAAMGADDFVKAGPVGHLRCRSLVVGSNVRCGRGGTSDSAFLERTGPRLSFGVEVILLVRHQARTCSSTAIRQAPVRGDVAVPRALTLGREDSRILARAHA